MSEAKEASKTLGQVQIADEVISIIAGTAALEVEGVEGMSGNIAGGISEMLGKKNLSKGVKISVSEGTVSVSINMTVKFGSKINVVAEEVQKRISVAIETMTGLTVKEVNVNVSGISFEKQKEAKDIQID